MNTQKDEIRKKVEVEIQKYLHSNTNHKEYTQSMKDISNWLQQKAKS